MTRCRVTYLADLSPPMILSNSCPQESLEMPRQCHPVYYSNSVIDYSITDKREPPAKRSTWEKMTWRRWLGWIISTYLFSYTFLFLSSFWARLIDHSSAQQPADLLVSIDSVLLCISCLKLLKLASRKNLRIFSANSYSLSRLDGCHISPLLESWTSNCQERRSYYLLKTFLSSINLTDRNALCQGENQSSVD